MKIALAKKSQSEGFDFFILNSDNDAKFHYTLKIRNNKPHRFLKDSEFKRPKNAIDLLRKADSVFIESNPEIEQMLDKYQISYEEKNFCRYCRIEDKVTILRNNQGFQWHGDIICKDCALEQLEKEAQYRYNKRISDMEWKEEWTPRAVLLFYFSVMMFAIFTMTINLVMS